MVRALGKILFISTMNSTWKNWLDEGRKLQTKTTVLMSTFGVGSESHREGI